MAEGKNLRRTYHDTIHFFPVGGVVFLDTCLSVGCSELSSPSSWCLVPLSKSGSLFCCLVPACSILNWLSGKSSFRLISSSHSNRQVMLPLAFNNAVANHPTVSLASLWFFCIHALNISLIISNVFVRLFIRNLLMSSMEKPSSIPRRRYSVDTLSATASNSSGNTWVCPIRVTGWSCWAMNIMKYLK